MIVDYGGDRSSMRRLSKTPGPVFQRHPAPDFGPLRPPQAAMTFISGISRHRVRNLGFMRPRARPADGLFLSVWDLDLYGAHVGDLHRAYTSCTDTRRPSSSADR